MPDDDVSIGEPDAARVGLATIAREWGRLGCIGFGGPPAHIRLLRALVVEQRRWLSPEEFEDGVAAVNLLPGPASTQLCIYAAWRLRGTRGALVGGVAFIVPGLAAILGLAALFLQTRPPLVVAGLAAGAGAAVPAVALHAALSLMPASWRRAGPRRAPRSRWVAFAVTGAMAAAVIGPWVVLVLATAGSVEVAARAVGRGGPTAEGGESRGHGGAWLPAAVHAGTLAAGGLGAVAWVAVKVGALSYGGGFVIVPLMQRDAVHTYHWMTAAQFLDAVALGQVTPGPVVQTVAVVGYAAAGLGGGLLAAACAFSPSFAAVVAGAPHFDRLRTSPAVQAFLTGAGAAAIGAIAGSAVPLGLALTHVWQAAVLAAALVWLVAAGRGVVSALGAAALAGLTAVAAGAPH